jgi:nitrite reductase/ring-hydroxylating ferredoxin subunit
MSAYPVRIRYTPRVTTFYAVGPLERFPDSKIRRVFLDGREIAVVQYNERFYAFSNRCTHNDFQLHFGYIEDGCVWCPIHYGQFELETGHAVSGPVTDLASYEVRVVDGEVQVGVPEAEAAAKSEPAGEAG